LQTNDRLVRQIELNLSLKENILMKLNCVKTLKLALGAAAMMGSMASYGATPATSMPANDIGALIGVALQSGSNGGNGTGNLEFGLEYRHLVQSNFNAGLFGTYFSPGQNTSDWQYGVMGNYVFAENAPGLQIGVQLGLNTFSVNGVNASTTSFIFGPRATYDYSLGGGLYVGPEANIMFSTATGGGTIVNLAGVIRYGF
jgi:hypothetical protein